MKLHLKKQEYSSVIPLSQQMLTNILDYARENSELFKALLSENCDFAFQKGILEIAQIVSSQHYTGLDPRKNEYLRAFVAAGCISILQNWLRDGAVESSEYISELVMQILQKGTFTFFTH